MATSNELLPCLPCGARRSPCDRDQQVPCSLCVEKNRTCDTTWQVGPQLSALLPTEYRDLEHKKTLTIKPGPSLGRGANGTVVLADVKGETVPLVIKVAGPSEESWERLTMLMTREAIAWSRVTGHPNIAKFLGIINYNSLGNVSRMSGVPESGRLGLVTEHLTGGSVTRYLKDHPEASLTKVLQEIITGLAHLHKNNVLHGDLHPENVLVRQGASRGQFDTVLIDFGLSYVEEDEPFLSNSTLTTYMGAQTFLAFERAFPESAYGESRSRARAKTKASDVFEMMRLFLNLMTGKLPYSELGRDHVRIYEHMTGGINPQKPEYGVNDDTWALMKRAWAHPLQRPKLEEIERFFEDRKHLPRTLDEGKNVHPTD